MGLRDWWYSNHHAPHHHRKEVESAITPDGHARVVESTHCNKRNCSTDHAHGVEPELGNPYHGRRTDAIADFHPHPPCPPPVIGGPVPLPGPVIVVEPPVVTRVVETRICPAPAPVLTWVGPWRPVGNCPPVEREPTCEAPQAEPKGSFYRP